ncbi:ribonuclease P protein component [Pseudorhodoferax sp.]|uniref:ribonuclease P protein component n=1 Tax=Pseudorhodoferax sp. TaxID=1993553 RepID=UPI0039E58035
MQRLRTRAQFQAVMAGAPVSRTAHFALHRIALPPPAATAQAGARPLFAAEDVWIGAVLPKRWARRAVTRNAIRRQIYAVAGAHAAALPRAAHVVRLRTGFDRQQFVSASSDRLKQAVRSELEQLMRRAATAA